MVWWDFGDVDCDEERRGWLNQRMREGVAPEGVWADCGDAAADERGHPPRDGVHYSSADEIWEYYDELRINTFKLTDEG